MLLTVMRQWEKYSLSTVFENVFSSLIVNYLSTRSRQLHLSSESVSEFGEYNIETISRALLPKCQEEGVSGLVTSEMHAEL